MVQSPYKEVRQEFVPYLILIKKLDMVQTPYKEVRYGTNSL